ncbi:MAG: type II toxin-antitoxin system RatA family toxin [Pseudomonadota bacterium]
MTIIDRSALLPFGAAQLFALVNDVEAYPSYMDGCVGAEVLRREVDMIEARLDLAMGGISQSFSTRNRLVPDSQITLQLLDGPFERFEGCWRFQPLADAGCKLSLNLEFSFSNAVLSAAAARLFDKVTGNLVDAVGKRAQALYG